MAVVVKEKKEKKRERNKDTKDKKSRNKITARASVFGDNALYDALLNAQPKIGVWLTFSPLQQLAVARRVQRSCQPTNDVHDGYQEHSHDSLCQPRRSPIPNMASTKGTVAAPSTRKACQCTGRINPRPSQCFLLVSLVFRFIWANGSLPTFPNSL